MVRKHILSRTFPGNPILRRSSFYDNPDTILITGIFIIINRAMVVNQLSKIRRAVRSKCRRTLSILL